MTPESLGNALVPIVGALVLLAATVLGAFTMLTRRTDKEIKRVDERNVELTTENEVLREQFRLSQDERHTMKRELDDIRKERDMLMARLDGLGQQLTDALTRIGKQEDRLTALQGELESERRFSQGRIDATEGARQKAELKAVQLEAEVRTLIVQKDALAQRLEDQAVAHKAEMEMLKAQAAKLEAESRLLSKSIDDRVRTATEAATRELRQELDKIVKERGHLESRLHELESKGVTTNEA